MVTGVLITVLLKSRTGSKPYVPTQARGRVAKLGVDGQQHGVHGSNPHRVHDQLR